jgi:hypothetical protein
MKYTGYATVRNDEAGATLHLKRVIVYSYAPSLPDLEGVIKPEQSVTSGLFCEAIAPQKLFPGRQTSKGKGRNHAPVKNKV